MIFKKNNKKGMGFILIISLIVVVLVLSLIASYFGLKFLQNAVEEIGTGTIIAMIIVVLAIVFKDFVGNLLNFILSLLKSFISAMAGILRGIF